jgi:excisionase family DNA binding protein
MQHAERGLTVPEVAARLRVGRDRIRGWIRRGELRAINTGRTRCGRPRYVVTPEALAEFERGHDATTPAARPRRRRREPDRPDFLPELIG